MILNYVSIDKKKIICLNIQTAGVVEQADALDSKSSEGNLVRVRFSPPALLEKFYHYKKIALRFHLYGLKISVEMIFVDWQK